MQQPKKLIGSDPYNGSVRINKMPNLKGGKNYKKMKHGAGPAKPELHEIGEGQMLGRVLRLLGDRQAAVYCNDGIERHCRIRGKLRKRVWIATGDMVLISLRILECGEESDEDADTDDVSFSAATLRNAKKGDILAKYDAEVYGKLKKLEGVNKRLFDGIDAITSKTGVKGLTGDDEGDIFDHGDGEDAASEDEMRGKRWKRPAAAPVEEDDNAEIDIDAI